MKFLRILKLPVLFVGAKTNQLMNLRGQGADLYPVAICVFGVKKKVWIQEWIQVRGGELQFSHFPSQNSLCASASNLLSPKIQLFKDW